MLESKSSALTNLATPLHGSMVCVATPAIHRSLVAGGPSDERMNLQIAAFSHLPVCWCLRRGVRRAFRHSCKHRASRTGHPPRQALLGKPVECQFDLRTEAFGHRLQVVAAEAERVCCKARNYSSGRGAFEPGGSEHARGIEPGAWLGDDEAGRRQRLRTVQWRDALADALDPGIASAQEERHVGAEPQRD